MSREYKLVKIMSCAWCPYLERQKRKRFCLLSKRLLNRANGFEIDNLEANFPSWCELEGYSEVE